MLTTDSPEILEFLQLWPSPFGRDVRAKQRRAYIAIDYANGPDSWCGAFLVDRLTHRVFKTKGYGVKGWAVGTIESLINDYRNQRRMRDELCSACGSPKPADQSCGCFDNGSE